MYCPDCGSETERLGVRYEGYKGSRIVVFWYCPKCERVWAEVQDTIDMSYWIEAVGMSKEEILKIVEDGEDEG